MTTASGSPSTSAVSAPQAHCAILVTSDFSIQRTLAQSDRYLGATAANRDRGDDDQSCAGRRLHDCAVTHRHAIHAVEPGFSCAHRERLHGELRDKFLGFRPAATTGAVAVGQFDAERESGGVAVEVLGAGEIKQVKTKGLEEADASDLGGAISNRQSPSLAAFRFRSGDATQTRTLALDIARYTQQAVLMANVEEARYQVLMSREGKTLVQARYAVRNNQRNFVKVSLPPGAMVWSASVAGKPARPGQSPDGSLLLPLEKARGGDDPPAFIVEVFYVIREAAWEEKVKSHLALPALDLPISRTGVVVYYPPLFRVTVEPGSFRTEAYAAPTSAAFEQPMLPAASAGKVTERMITVMNKELNDKDDQSTQTLIDKFQEKSRSGRIAGILPIGVDFPAYGPSTYLVSELTSEGQFPEANLNYQRDKKAGAR